MTTISRQWISGGDAGVYDTLALMQSCARDGMRSPSVVFLARQLAVRGGVRRPYWQAVAIQSWLSRVWRYVDDPRDEELLIDPAALLAAYDTLGVIPGDCDEAAILGAALGLAIGMTAEFVVLGFPSPDAGENGRYAHVFTVLLTDDGQSVSLDVTRPPGPVAAPSRMLQWPV